MAKAEDAETGKPGTMGCLHIARRAFPETGLEQLYLSYNVRQKREGLYCFVMAAIFYDIFYTYDGTISWVFFICLLINLLLSLWCLFLLRTCRPVWKIVPYICWGVFFAQILLFFFLKTSHVNGRDNLGWVVVLDYLLYVLLPLRLRYCVLLSVTTCVVYVSMIAVLAHEEPHLAEQLSANAFLLLGANILGLTSYLLSDRQQRRAFLETKQSLEMKLVMEEQALEQETLLLSVLPEHVAVKMRADLGSCVSGQFNKIYMSRHENVSILYADIVGFTAISSTYSASELVKILNELFARFDRLSEKYHQLRIKILGDCYYCISGAPIERPDHAVLCVHMGLSMVKAIKYVQQTCNSPVDMRVGIHTGAVLAGVLGQTQWQFDVYSKDVELANKMESSGKPGRVHISEKTLSFLNGEFEVEPGYGEKREETLRMAGIKTYFIVKVLKPFQPAPSSSSGGQNGNVADDPCQLGDTVNSDAEFEKEESQALNSNGKERRPSEDFKDRLRKVLIDKGGLSSLNDHISCFTLTFRDAGKEESFNHNKETAATLSLLGCPVVLFFISIAQIIILPRDGLSILSFTAGFIVLTLFAVIAIAELIPQVFPKALVQCSTAVNNTLWARRLLAAAAVLVLGSINAVDMVSCDLAAYPLNCTAAFRASANNSDDCLYPSYFSYCCVLVLVAASLPTQISYHLKILLFFIIVAVHCLMNLFVIQSALDCEERVDMNTHLMSTKYALCQLLILIALILSVLARHVEKATRMLFQWKTEVAEQQAKISDLREKNEALVYNILPPHVAVHFLGSRKRQHEELYSQSYSDVGVLFASMPNFTDFYSEETVNNQGLECLRFLNEVISDFDAILKRDEYKHNIIKIKTIGSTYMAASGLNKSAVFRGDEPVSKRWAHLALLVDFAFEMKKALQFLNEQSFNHFVLKMGINHGPITAGVIGARKPHYDIWGNTVNVASRMESTGKAGCIQVTDETCNILKNFGFVFEQRGLVAVKGKGQLMTYYLIAKPEPQKSVIIPSAMETLREEEEIELPDPIGKNHIRNLLAEESKLLPLNGN